MQRRLLGATKIECSALGFGCVSLTMHDDRRRAIELLERAFDLGVTHFDVARLYGFGEAEGILGGFLRGKRDRVTVATKFGLAPPAALSKHRGLISAARRIAHRFPLAAKIAGRARNATNQVGSFTPREAAGSLETSLRELGTDYIDIVLLHEATVADAARDDLREFLDAQVKHGRVGAYGVASSFDKLRGDASLFASGYEVLQFESSAAEPNIDHLANAASRGVINFGCVNGAERIARAAATTPEMVARYRDAVGDDLANPAIVTSWMLRSALAANPRGVILFGTTNRQHLEDNLREAERAIDTQALTAFNLFASEATEQAKRGRGL